MIYVNPNDNNSNRYFYAFNQNAWYISNTPHKQEIDIVHFNEDYVTVSTISGHFVTRNYGYAEKHSLRGWHTLHPANRLISMIYPDLFYNVKLEDKKHWFIKWLRRLWIWVILN